VLDKVNQIAGAQYSELRDNLGEIETFYAQYKDQRESFVSPARVPFHTLPPPLTTSRHRSVALLEVGR
jgi:hypothetical protein